MSKQLEKREYWITYVVYCDQEREDYDFEDEFDTRKAAREFAKHFSNPMIKVCASLDSPYPISGFEFAYGMTKAEAFRKLKKQVELYGFVPYDPYKD